ncbi:MAG: hypothetical protein JF609_12465, partial [Verrucomicrobia bacterium]|nr:hypothetical protein [Verrucomicrobiota bacterium]
DLATMLRDYLNWLEQHQLQDADCSLSKAAEALQLSRSAPAEAGATRFTVGQLWVDGFAELSEQELELLGQLFAHCNGATMTFCLDGLPKKSSWLSTWSLTRKTFEDCRRKFAALAGVETRIEVLPRHPDRGRFFNNPVLQHL